MRMASEYASSPVAHPGIHKTKLVGRRRPFQEIGNDQLFEQVESFSIAEETCHADQEVAVEEVELGVIDTKAVRIRLDIDRVTHIHSPFDAANHSRRLIVGKFDAELLREQPEDGADAAWLDGAALKCPIRRTHSLHVIDERLRHLRRRVEMVDDAGVACALRHAVERGRFVLTEHEPARRVNVAETARPVAPAAREDDSDRARAAIFRE